MRPSPRFRTPRALAAFFRRRRRWRRQRGVCWRFCFMYSATVCLSPPLQEKNMKVKRGSGACRDQSVPVLDEWYACNAAFSYGKENKRPVRLHGWLGRAPHCTPILLRALLFGAYVRWLFFFGECLSLSLLLCLLAVSRLFRLIERVRGQGVNGLEDGRLRRVCVGVCY